MVTGSRGFIGRNLSCHLKNRGYNCLECDIDNQNELQLLVEKSDFVFHLAGVNRPKEISEFYKGNSDFTKELIQAIKKTNRKVPVCLSSSIQASFENDYGKSKKLAEDLLLAFQKENDNPVYIYRLQNVFGKWCRPNYNSVIATFCYNVSHSIPLTIVDPAITRDFVYIDDVCDSFCDLLVHNGRQTSSLLSVNPFYSKSIGEVAELISSFPRFRENLLLPNVGDPFVSKLYATYLSYLEPENGFSYGLSPHFDDRGSFTEFFRTLSAGQLSINVSKPGIVKGNHYHHTKTEKFLVVKGKCQIKFRKIGESEVFEYNVDGDHLSVIDIPCGYTHSIENVGEDDSITLMWASELFDPNNPDTYFEVV